MRLDFNYWVSNRLDIIVSILNDDCNTFISFRKKFKIKRFISIDPNDATVTLSFVG